MFSRVWRGTVQWRLLRLLGSASEAEEAAGRWRGRVQSKGKGKTLQLSVSSLRIDAVAAAGLDLSRQKIWEAALEERLLLNGETVRKKSASVANGDIIEVDVTLSDDVRGEVVRRGRVEVVEIGGRTRRGGHHMTLTRFKHFDDFEKL